MTVTELLHRAAAQKATLAATDNETRNRALCEMAKALRFHTKAILLANERDLENADGKISEVMKDRLRLTSERISAMADAVEEVTRLPDPLGLEQSNVTRENGINIKKVSVPLGGLAMR